MAKMQMTYDDLPEDVKQTIEIKKRNMEILEGLRNLPSNWGVPKEPMEISKMKKTSLYNNPSLRNILPRTRHVKRKTILKFKVGDTFREKGCPFTIIKIARKYIWVEELGFSEGVGFHTKVKKYVPQDLQKLIDMSKYRTSHFAKHRRSLWPK